MCIRDRIQNATVRDNIIFASNYDENQYKKAVETSCLDDGLKIMTDGDKTEIGEKGVNLSGGQKARVALARAVYSDADIYLLDDVLSAVDVHVGEAIFKNCICGALSKKTRILVTHALQYLRFVDKVVIMKNGRIIEQGDFETISRTSAYEEITRLEREREEQARKAEEAEKAQKAAAQEKEAKKKTTPEPVVEQKVANPEEESLKPESVVRKEEKFEDVSNLMMKEDRQKGQVTSSTYGTLIKYSGGYCFYLFVLLILLIFKGTQTGSNLWLAYWADHPSLENNLSYFGIYAALGLSFGVFCALRVLVLTLRHMNTISVVHGEMIRSLLRAPITQFFERIPVGRILGRFTADLGAFDTGYITGVGAPMLAMYNLLTDLIVAIWGSLGIIFPLVVVYFLCIIYITKRYRKTYSEVFRLDNISRTPVISNFEQTLAGVTTIRAFGKEEIFLRKFIEISDSRTKCMLASDAINSWFGVRLSFLSQFFIVLPCLLIVILYRNYLAASLSAFLLTYCFTIEQDVQGLVMSLVGLERCVISFERCVSFTQVPPEDDGHKIAPLPPRWPSAGKIEFQHYYTKYRSNLPCILRNLSFAVNPGEKIGIVGRTGAGKSSIILSILRIIEPYNGSIIIDGANIADIGLFELRSNISIIPQDSYLFTGTLRENLDPTAAYTDAALKDSLEKVGIAKQFEQRGGLDMQITEGGSNLRISN
eukprot:TRINITY_DN2466_c0_g2_i8.p1 TRINITY_DN2466_c0_g2~~TRINITY_DN2466_c0_g2_i8.p1  ORF type:complete len:708 (-),score=238.61 TRINITY_DN2466_c0_g2_i8:747-2870(-)